MDELRAPLGLNRRPRRNLRRYVPYAAVALLLAFAGGVLWAFVAGPPDEPEAVAEIRRLPLPETRPVRENASTPVVPPAAPAPANGAPEGGPLIIKIPRATGSASSTSSAGATAGEALQEVSPHGPVPRIAPDGRRPLDVYARAAQPDPQRPRIALLLASGGGARPEMAAALPADITWALDPSAEGLKAQAAELRRLGREYMLQLPVEGHDPGSAEPHTLRADFPVAGNLDQLAWVMSRSSGYIGVAATGGGKFLADDAALQPVLRDVARRGLAFVDATALPGSRLLHAEAAESLPLARAELAMGGDIGTLPDALARLETVARMNGEALGVLRGPVDAGALTGWVGTLAGRGLQLVPVSALVRHRRPSEQPQIGDSNGRP